MKLAPCGESYEELANELRHLRAARRAEAREGTRQGSPTQLRRSGAASFVCQKLAWFTEPKLSRDSTCPPPPLRGSGAASFAWLAEPKLTLRR